MVWPASKIMRRPFLLRSFHDLGGAHRGITSELIESTLRNDFIVSAESLSIAQASSKSAQESSSLFIRFSCHRFKHPVTRLGKIQSALKPERKWQSENRFCGRRLGKKNHWLFRFASLFLASSTSGIPGSASFQISRKRS